MALKIGAWIELEAHASAVVDNIFDREMAVSRLEMIRQAIGRAAEIVAFVLESGPEIPFAFDQETMVVAEIVVERTTFA